LSPSGALVLGPPPPATYLEHELGTTPLQTVICKKFVDKFIEASIS